MVTSLQKNLLLIVMALVLLAGLLGWTKGMVATPTTYPQHSISIQHNHAPAIGPRLGCPPPPYDCW